MNRSNIKFIILIISIVFFIGTIGLITFMYQIDKQTEDTTTYYSATITTTRIINTGENVSAEIYTKEYSTSLYITTTISKNIDMNDIRELKKGQKIFFRIENIKSAQMNKVDFIDIVSLNTDAKDIFSLDEYNRYMNSFAYPTRIAGVVLALLFMAISLFCIFLIRRKQGARD